MVNFGERLSVPERYSGRSLYQHNPQVTLMRTNVEECAQLGRILAQKVNAYRGPVTVMIPCRAVSVISAEGQPFHDPAADAALFQAIHENLQEGVGIAEVDLEINDPVFARKCAEALIGLMQTMS